jgi:hypothetical protein
MSSRLWVLVLFGACGGEGPEPGTAPAPTPTPNGGTSPEVIAQTAACAMYIECLTATAPSEVGAAVAEYGEEGTCWTSQSGADSCDAACVAAVEEIHQRVPNEPACDDGSSLWAATIFGGAPSSWDFQVIEELSNDCRNQTTDEVDLEIVPGEGTSFTVSGTSLSFAWYYQGIPTPYGVGYGERIDIPETGCTNDDYAYVCDPAVLEHVIFDGTIELSGTVAPSGDTATMTAILRLDGAGCTIEAALEGSRGF